MKLENFIVFVIGYVFVEEVDDGLYLFIEIVGIGVLSLFY